MSPTEIARGGPGRGLRPAARRGTSIAPSSAMGGRGETSEAERGLVGAHARASRDEAADKPPVWAVVLGIAVLIALAVLAIKD